MSWGDFKPRLADAVRSILSLHSSAPQRLHCTYSEALKGCGKVSECEGKQYNVQPAKEGHKCALACMKVCVFTEILNNGFRRLGDAQVIAHLEPLQQRYSAIMEDDGYLDSVLAEGAGEPLSPPLALLCAPAGCVRL